MSRIWKLASIVGEFPINYNPPPNPKEPEEEVHQKVEEPPPPSPEEERETLLKEAQKEAQLLLESARKESRDLVEKARKKAQYLQEEAKKKGLTSGHQEGKDAFIKKSQHILNRLEVCLQEVQHRMENYEKEYPEKITQLSLGIAREVIRREVQEDPQIVVQVTKEALSSMNGVAEATIRVNWEDLEIMEEATEDLLASLKGLRRVRFQVDKELEPGGTIIETSQGGIDASIATRFSRMKEDLLEVINSE